MSLPFNLLFVESIFTNRRFFLLQAKHQFFSGYTAFTK